MHHHCKFSHNFILAIVNFLTILYWHLRACVTGGEIDKELLYTIGAMLVVTICLWLQLAWFQHDPGSVDTRYQDFDAVHVYIYNFSELFFVQLIWLDF